MALSKTHYFHKNLCEHFSDNIKLSFISRLSVIIITKEDIVYEFDRNTINNSFIAFNKNKLFNEKKISESQNLILSNKGIIEIKNGFFHSIARTFDGKIYCWGTNNEFGLLGNGRQDHNSYKAELNESLKDKNIIEMSCGGEHTLVLTIDGEVYGWGNNGWGQIGNRKSGFKQCEAVPYLVNEFNGVKVKSVSCGEWHSLALTQSGIVYSWGYNEYGQLGRITSTSNDLNLPKPIELKQDIKFEKIICGRFHSLLLSTDGDIHVFGDNSESQLGIKMEYDFQILPIKLNFSQKFTEIVAHYRSNFSCALSLNDKYYIWGHFIEKEIIKEPKATDFRSFNNIFSYYLGISYKPNEEHIMEFSDDFIRNGFYKKEFCENKFIGRGGYGEVYKVNKPSFNLLKVNSSLQNLEIDNFLKDFRSGNFGKVSNIINMDKGIKYAVKKIKLNISKSRETSEEENIESILKELDLFSVIKGLRDQKIVEYFDLWFENEDPKSSNLIVFIQMELCDKSLIDVMEDIKNDRNLVDNNCLTLLGYYNVKQYYNYILSKLFTQILEGVHYLHTRDPQIIHRDLKPENILIKIIEQNNSVVKIADFGLICSHNQFVNTCEQNSILKQFDHTQDIGDIRYAAPEVLDSKKYDTKSDIYSLGIVAGQLFSFDSSSDKTPLNINTKYNELNNLHIKMTEEDNPNQRPDNQELMNSMHLWALSDNEFYTKNDFKNFCKICDEKYKKSYIFELIIKLSPNSLTIHRNCRCDECSAYPIIGTRHKCNECNKYNLCESCIEEPNEHPKTHTFYKYKQDIHEIRKRVLKKIKLTGANLFQNVECNVCHVKPLVGVRHKCDECEDFNLCEPCSNITNIHPETHTLCKMSNKDDVFGGMLKQVDNFLDNLNPNVVCDECRVKLLADTVYKCNECEDYILCELCKEKRDVHPETHNFSEMALVWNEDFIHNYEQMINTLSETMIPNFECHECHVKLQAGNGYQCNECENYNLCETCHNSHNKHPETHTFSKMSYERNNDYENIFEKINTLFAPTVHQNVKCDKCQAKPIVGVRYKCNKCEDYNLCESCKEQANGHPETHTFCELFKEEYNLDFIELD